MGGHTEAECAKKHKGTKKGDEIQKKLDEVRAKREALSKDKGKDEEKKDEKGAWDVQYINANQISLSPSIKPPPDDYHELSRMVKGLDVLIQNKAAKNKVKVLRHLIAGAVWHTIIDSGA